MSEFFEMEINVSYTQFGFEDSPWLVNLFTWGSYFAVQMCHKVVSYNIWTYNSNVCHNSMAKGSKKIFLNIMR